jgi:hypothetical protein
LKSKYCDKDITAAQYIAELVCEKRARQLDVDLCNHFWQLPAWKNFFISQIRLANKLLSSHDTEIVLRAIRESDVGTLRNPQVKTNIVKLEKSAKLINMHNNHTVDGFSSGREHKSKSILDQLDE